MNDLTAATPQLQCFEADTLALREVWSCCAVAAGHNWKRKGPNENSDSRPFDVEDEQGRRGKAKPGCVRKNPDVSRAAHEKIASDLAARFGLPIPPVTLYKLDGPLEADPRTKEPGDPYICVSAWAFPACDMWDKHRSVITEAERASTIPALSAMWVFDSWISAEDRAYGKHILVSPNGAPPLRIACVDYAFSLSKSWASSVTQKAVGWSMPFEEAKKDMGSVTSIAGRIAELPDVVIKEIVSRVAPGWLPVDRAELILKGLLERRSQIYQIIGIPRPQP